MRVFHEEFPDIQAEVMTDRFLNLRTGPEEPNEDEDLDYSDDDLGENTETTPLGDDMDEDDVNALKSVAPPDDDDLLSDDDDDDWDVETEQYLEEEDDIVDITTSAQNDPDDDVDPDDDDDLDDDDLFEEEDDDDLLADDDDDTWDEDTTDDAVSADDDQPVTDTDAPQTLSTPDTGFSSRREERRTGRMIGHEPGTAGTGPEI